MLVQKITINERLIIKNPNAWLRGEIIKANTFKNPRFYEAEKHGHYLGDISSQIQTFESNGEDLLVERGYYHEFLKLINENSLSVELNESTQCPTIIYPELLNIYLRPYQTKALEQALKYNQGVIVAPTGSGKTIIGLDLIRRRQTRSLILVHTKELANQWIAQIKNMLNINPGMIGDGLWDFKEGITVAIVQTLDRQRDRCKGMAQQIGLILCDECHHAPAKMFNRVIGMFPSKYRYGLSATPIRRDGLDFLIFRVMGNEIARVSRGSVQIFV